MVNGLNSAEWLGFLSSEYLTTYVSDGGAAIKFAIPLDPEDHESLVADLGSLAEEAGFLTVSVLAIETKVHMPDQVFFRIAEQVPWRRMAHQVVARLAAQAGYDVPGTAGPLIPALAEANAMDGNLIALELRRLIANEVYKRRGLAKDFRVAMTQMCLGELTGGDDAEVTAGVLQDWLTGRLTSIGAVKPYQIFNRINRSNARHIFGSLLHWVRYAGFPGLMVVLDIRRVTEPRNPRDGTVYYTKAAMLDAYEVLRQFIDGTDRLEGCLIVVAANAAFLDDDPSGRGMGAYQALKFRIYDEVRDRNMPNPLASLARLGAAPHGEAGI